MKIAHWDIPLGTEILIIRSLYPLKICGFVSPLQSKLKFLSKFCWFDFHFLFHAFSSPILPFICQKALSGLFTCEKNLEHHVVRFQGNTESHSILISSLTATIESIMFSMPSSWPPRRSQTTFHLLCQSHSDHVHFSLLTHCHVTS